MRRSRSSGIAAPVWLVWVLMLSAAPACSDDVSAPAQIAHDAGVDGRASPDGATPPDGFAGGGNGGSGAADAMASGGATDARVGTENGGAASGGKGSGTAGNRSTGGVEGTCEITAGQDGSAPEPLAICARLQSASVLAFDVTRAYDHAVYGDCRVAWVIDLYLDVNKRAEFLNTLLAWNMKLWGCNAPAPEDFALIFEAVPLTAGDAAALVDDYLDVATQSLELSPAEITKLRATLAYLARPLIADASCELSHSRCVVDAGVDGSPGAGGGSGGGSGNGGVSGAGGGGEGGAGGASGAGGEGGAGEGGATNPTGDASSAGGALDASTGAEAGARGAPN
jgi:hypothetical protein